MRQKGKAKKRPKDTQLAGTKKRKELVPLMVGSDPMAPLMSSTCKLWDLMVMGGLEQISFINAIFLSIAKAKAH
jgi:hypothetical protein